MYSRKGQTSNWEKPVDKLGIDVDKKKLSINESAP
jgi:hypothetical protein